MKNKIEKLYFSGIPEKRLKLVELAIDTGFGLARENLLVKDKVDLTLLTLTKQQGKNYLSVGKTTKKGINIWVSKKYLGSRSMFADLYGTVIHEYVHFIRQILGVHNTKKVINITIEEGIAIYIQSTLCRPPKYLEVKSLSEKTVENIWKKFSQVYNKPSNKFPAIEKNTIYRTLNYRLGFGIVRRFMNENPKITLAKLVRINNEKIIKFTEKKYLDILT